MHQDHLLDARQDIEVGAFDAVKSILDKEVEAEKGIYEHRLEWFEGKSSQQSIIVNMEKLSLSTFVSYRTSEVVVVYKPPVTWLRLESMLRTNAINSHRHPDYKINIADSKDTEVSAMSKIGLLQAVGL